jgi:hypothetical protein
LEVISDSDGSVGQELDRLIERLHFDIIDPHGLVTPPGYAHIALCLIDAVFSIRAKYASVRRVVTHYCTITGVRDEGLDAVDTPSHIEHTLPAFLRQVELHRDPEHLFSTNKAKSGGRLKSELCVEVAQRLVAEGIQSRSDLVQNFDDAKAKTAWIGTHGLGWITWQYFGSLNGLQQVKPDTHVVAYVRDVLGRSVTPGEVDLLVKGAAGALSVPVRALEHSIWRLGSKWDTSSGDGQTLSKQTGDSISFVVKGRPPPKTGSPSVLGTRSRYPDRVTALLEAARDEMERTDFSGFGNSPIRLDLQIRTGPGEPPWDATNLLGGVADVLDSKSHKQIAQPGMLNHLGELADVALFDDDRQIQEITYRTVQHPQEEYVVTILRLP